MGQGHLTFIMTRWGVLNHYENKSRLEKALGSLKEANLLGLKPLV